LKIESIFKIPLYIKINVYFLKENYLHISKFRRGSREEMDVNVGREL
jgi:hypothetical protein